MTKVIFDIETIGKDFEQLDEVSREYLEKSFERYLKTEEEIEEAKDQLSFSPLTGEIVAVAMINQETSGGVVYFQAPNKKIEEFEENGVRFIPGDEREILSNFWRDIKNFRQFITFNGRTFDCPYLMIRSAVNKVRPTKNLMPYRYASEEHVDLFDQLTFYGAVRRKFNLHMWCKAFDVKSPKEEGISGEDVKQLFKEEKYAEIARYCLGDVFATKELYQYWEKYLKF
ncbi:MAG: hypothetical protein UX53_C0010G0009 [Candidatus Azambacteria bacterium GW2011_GWB2_46_37]|uniref:Predicted 3'-5' exonuclease PolB-like domain-containing protein n=8 Tax=Candidatus Azamiibacteriota TaxID=1752741 RepID=A0A1F5C793_9BACT|nr:MAG: hypothetical protein UX33_C0001G0038 [Candidatus Azambacteria bacterium GW2011_GWC1_46_13]KKU34816.1 MAG: hypothetical protein UX48_C0024G0009 [Candidatus Azambacteria bacterium GW2011_GWB1_46_27]KKU38031.1 MAG: hypothetical protein UX51_C0007G0009 [Candidatus Azambacteria bacterium GW2011_GWF2_46_32]KKU39274.1 MAG: hypothetical protein UX53_C0010G0009 [Candidatus Azambacteria bacterium GW2011_GWB2_46_37]KKU39991.1 MAG: hypothetical protein UX55_C0019G0003 [Candidatus Azambacteria bacte